MPDIAYRMSWTQTGLEETVDKSIRSVEKLSTSTSSLISRLERKAAIADMGADAFALAQAKASGAASSTLDYISALQGVINKTKELKEESASAAAAQAKMDKDRQLHIAARREAVPDNEELRRQYEYRSKPLREAADVAREAAEKEAYRRSVADKSRGVPNNELLRMESETRRLSAGQRELNAISDQLKQTTRELRTEEIAAIETRMRLAGATEAQQAAARGMISAHAPTVGMPLQRIKYDPSRSSSGFSRGGMVALEASRAVEDAVAGGAYGGVKGAIMGASNNIAMVGAAMGPKGAVIGTLISMFGMLGVTAWSAYERAGAGADKAAGSQDRLKNSIQGTLDILRDEISLREELASIEDVRGKREAERMKASKVDKVKDLNAEQKVYRQSLSDMMIKVGLPANESINNLPGIAANGLRIAGNPFEGRRDVNIAPGTVTPEFIATAREIESKIVGLNHQIFSAETARDKAGKVLVRETIAEQGIEYDAAMASRKATREQDASDRLARRDKRRQQTEALGMMRLDLLGDGDPEASVRRQAAKLEVERRDRDQKIKAARSEGLITKDESEKMLSQSYWKREFENNQLAKNSVQETQRGQSAQALDVRSSEGMAQLLRALNSGKDEISQQQLDVQRQIEQGIRDGNTIKPIDVKEVHWS